MWMAGSQGRRCGRAGCSARRRGVRLGWSVTMVSSWTLVEAQPVRSLVSIAVGRTRTVAVAQVGGAPVLAARAWSVCRIGEPPGRGCGRSGPGRSRNGLARCREVAAAGVGAGQLSGERVGEHAGAPTRWSSRSAVPSRRSSAARFASDAVACVDVVGMLVDVLADSWIGLAKDKTAGQSELPNAWAAGRIRGFNGSASSGPRGPAPGRPRPGTPRYSWAFSPLGLGSTHELGAGQAAAVGDPAGPSGCRMPAGRR